MPPSVHLVFGNDEYLVSKRARDIVDSLVPADNIVLGTEIVDGAVDTVDMAVAAASRCLSAVLTPGLFGGAKVVWFRNVNFLTDTQVGKSETVKPAVARLADAIKQGLPDGISLVVSAKAVHKSYAFYKACKAAGPVEDFSVPEKAHQANAAASARMTDLTRERNLTLARDARDAFLERVGTDTRQMVSELDKLAAYVGPRRQVSLSDVQAIVSYSREAPAWDLADAFGQRDLRRALELTRQLLFQKESPIRLVITLEGRIRDLMVLREAIQRKWLTSAGSKTISWGPVPEVAELMFSAEFERDPRSTAPYRTGLLAEQARKFSRDELRKCLQQAVSAHESLVSSSLPDSMVLETLLINMLS